MGWRYLLWTLGAVMMVLFVLRFFVFHLYESPKYLMGRGRDEDAVAVIHAVARYNGTTSSLTVEMLREVEVEAEGHGEKRALDTSAKGALRRKMSVLDTSHVRALFATKKMAYSTSLLIVLWGTQLVGVLGVRLLILGSVQRSSDSHFPCASGHWQLCCGVAADCVS